MKLEPGWEAVASRAEKMMRGTAWDTDWTYDLAPVAVEQGVQETVLDRYTRLYCEAFDIHPMLVWPLLAVGVSAACQGAFRTVLPVVGGRLVVSDVVQYTGVAGSGYGKSTFLDPHKERVGGCLDSGAAWRALEVPKRLAAAQDLASALMGKTLDEIQRDPAWGQIYGHGRAVATMTESGTSEGLRDGLLAGGGSLTVMTAEPDFYRELGAYAKDGGSIRVMLDGWDHASTTVSRAQGVTKYLRGQAMPYGILVQPTSFDEYTARRASPGGTGPVFDPFVERGVFGRSWLARFEEQPPTVWVDGGPDFWLPGEEHTGSGLTASLDAALLEYTAVLDAVVGRSNEYRLRNGLEQGWRTVTAGGAGADVPRPPAAAEAAQVLHLENSGEAREAYRQVQLVRLRLVETLKMLALEDPGSEQLFAPMVKRLTQHVVRFAMMLVLAWDPGAVAVPAWAIRDAGQRLLPWFLTWWFTEMRSRAKRQRQEDVEASTMSNKTSSALTMEGRVMDVLDKVIRKTKQVEHSESVVIRAVLETFTQPKRKELRPVVRSALLDLVSEGVLVETVVDNRGRPATRYRRASDLLDVG